VTNERETKRNFITDLIDADLESGKYDGRVVTRFPPEPNGFLHIGHAKSICLNFGLARDYGGKCHLRFDDTNPTTEDVRYVESIQRDIKWLGFDWGEDLFFASDYFEDLYNFAVKLIEQGQAYVCSLNESEIREYRGSLTEAGKPSPYRDRSVEENLDLFKRMRAGEFKDGEHVLRAKIDMAASNMKMRDPLLYRIRHAHHYRTGDDWCIYPMYDFAHCLSDALEAITHSICTLEFENNRALYDWIIQAVDTEYKPEQTEFARLALDYTVTSKRKLLQLVNEKHVSGWDDPRMPTVAGMRRRGYTPESIRAFCDLIGVAKANSLVDIGKLEYAVRDDLNYRCPRVMCVLDPIKVVLTNYDADKVEEIEAPYYPKDIGKEGSRSVPFGRELYIERDDYMEEPPKGFHRLRPGGEVRLRYAYVIRCDEVVKDEGGKVVELRCSVDPDTLGAAPKDRKVKGVIHWVEASASLPVEVRIYDRLFNVAKPDAAGEFLSHLNGDSLKVLPEARVEPSVATDGADTRYQFTRQGYFWRDPVDSAADSLVFNRIISLRDSWAGKEDAPAEVAQTQGSQKAKTRPPKKSRAEIRERARAGNAELAARYERYRKDLGIAEDVADLLTGEVEVGTFFEDALAGGASAERVAKWVTNNLMGEIKDRPVADLPFSGAQFGALVALVEEGASRSAAKKIFAIMLQEGGDPQTILKDQGLDQGLSEAELQGIVDAALADNPAELESYRGGKKALFGFFVGQVMRKAGGKAEAKQVQALLRQALDS
jgi:glutaminyl-tRNA synthetase